MDRYSQAMSGWGTPARPTAPHQPQPPESDTFTTGRRWLLGERRLVVGFERVSKMGKAMEGEITHYSQSSTSSIMVMNKHKVVYQLRNRDRLETIECDIRDGAVDTIIPSPFPGVFLIAMLPNGLKRTNSYGKLINIPGISYSLPATAFHWMPGGSQRDLYLLAGTLFGQVIEVIIPPEENAPARVTCLFICQEKGPTSSLISVKHNDQVYVLVSTQKDLVVLRYNGPGQQMTEVKSIVATHERKYCIPSFVVTNGVHVAWLTFEELRIYTVAQLIDELPGSCAVPMKQLSELVGVEQTVYLLQNRCPMVMSKFYVILCSPNVIVGFSTRDCSVAFKFPFAGKDIIMPLTIDPAAKAAFVATQQNLFKLDLKNEREANHVTPIRDEKEERIMSMEPSEMVQGSEILSSLIESGDYQKAVTFLTRHLRRVVDRTPPNDQRQSLSQEEIQQLCEQFLIYELGVIDACKRKTPDDFQAMVMVNPKIMEKFDVFGALVELLQRRAFSPEAAKIQDKALNEIRKYGDSPMTIKLLLEEGKVQDAIANIPRFGATQSTLAHLVFKHRDALKELYRQVDEKNRRISDIILQVLPFVTGDVDPATSLKLIQQEKARKSSQKPVDLLVWSICASETGREIDEELSEVFNRYNSGSLKLLMNPFSTLQHLLEAQLYHTAANIAGHLGLHREAVIAARKVPNGDIQLIYHFIRKAPKSMRGDLCREVDIELPRDNDDDELVRAATKETVAKELEATIEKLKVLGKQNEKSLQFLKELEEWGSTESQESQPQMHCGCCRKSMRGGYGYAFPCGHSLHQRCLEREMARILSPEEQARLGQLLKKTNPTREEIDEREKLLASDCPLCGMISASKIGVYIVSDEEKGDWSTAPYLSEAMRYPV